MNTHQLKASAESLRHGRLCGDYLRMRTSLSAMLAAAGGSYAERASLRENLISAFGLPDDATDEDIMREIDARLGPTAREQVGEALGIAIEKVVKLGTTDDDLRRYVYAEEERQRRERSQVLALRAGNPAMAPDVVRLRVTSGCKHTTPSPACVAKYGGGCHGACELDR